MGYTRSISIDQATLVSWNFHMFRRRLDIYTIIGLDGRTTMPNSIFYTAFDEMLSYVEIVVQTYA